MPKSIPCKDWETIHFLFWCYHELHPSHMRLQSSVSTVLYTPCYMNSFWLSTAHGKDLEKDVRSDTSGHFKRLMISMLTVSDPASVHACMLAYKQFMHAWTAWLHMYAVYMYMYMCKYMYVLLFCREPGSRMGQWTDRGQGLMPRYTFAHMHPQHVYMSTE